MNGKKGVLVLAAIAGLLGGTVAGCASNDKAAAEKNSCKGSGSCSAQSSCKGGSACKGGSSCKGESSCGKNSCG